MVLANYKLGDRTYQFDTEDVPEGAELVVPEAPAPAPKAAPQPPANKQRVSPNKH